MNEINMLCGVCSCGTIPQNLLCFGVLVLVIIGCVALLWWREQVLPIPRDRRMFK